MSGDNSIGSRRITDLRPDTRVPGNLLVEVDGARFASLPAEVIAHLDLSIDLEIDQARYRRLSQVADVEAAYRVAVRLLGARPRAVNELLRKLRERGHNPSAVAEAVGRLEERGVLDDAEFARHFTRVRLARGHGPARVLSDLLARGVERRVAERAIDLVVDEEGIDAAEEARAVATKRAAQLRDLPADKLRRRLLAYLGRRGYRGYEVRELVEELIGEENREWGAGG